MGQLFSCDRLASGVSCYIGEHKCDVILLEEGIFRVRYAFDKQEPVRPSFAVLLCSREEEAKGVLADEKRLTEPVPFALEETPEHLVLRTAKAEISVSKAPFAITVKDENGACIHRDIAGKAYARRHMRHAHTVAQDGFDQFYGFGEKTGPLNKFKTRLRMYCCDTLGYDAEKTDPLYKHIPFFIKRNSSQGTVLGMLYDVPREGEFDLGCERSGYWDPYFRFSCDGGAIDYYIMLGESIPQVVRRYTDLTGKTLLPPLQTLGYMGSTMYYTEADKDADQGVMHFIAELERQGFACDGFHLSSGYTTINAKRYVFHWNHERFPDPRAFIRWMNEKEVMLSPNIKPALLTDHPLYAEFAENNAFLMDAATGKPFLERYWGGMASFVDFSSPDGRRMWKKYMTQQLLDYGMPAIWDDNNEFELSGPEALCAGDGAPVPAIELKPVFANLMARTAVEAIREHSPTHRPYILSRSGYAGIQRYAQTWAGDNDTSWKSLRYNIPTMLGMGLSGVANQGCDIGGFQGPAPDAELFVRWVQNGIFQPRFCIHSCNTDNTVTQPWSYGSVTPVIRDAFELRYRMGLYLYSLMHQASTLGDPMMRPMVYAFEKDPAVAENSFDFLFGPFLLVANVLEPGANEREVYLPKGTAWYDWHTHTRYEGGQTICLPAPLSRIPMLYRAGSILPLIAPARRMRVENFAKVELLVAAEENAAFTLYQDDGKTTAYQNGDFVKTHITVENTPVGVTLAFAKEGAFGDVMEQFEIRLVSRFESPLRIDVSGRTLPLFVDDTAYAGAAEGCYFDMEARHSFIKFNNQPGNFDVNVDFSIRDLIGM